MEEDVLRGEAQDCAAGRRQQETQNATGCEQHEDHRTVGEGTGRSTAWTTFSAGESHACQPATGIDEVPRRFSADYAVYGRPM